MSFTLIVNYNFQFLEYLENKKVLLKLIQNHDDQHVCWDQCLLIFSLNATHTSYEVLDW